MTSKLASLHSGLVARKGEAVPAVPHPMFSTVDALPFVGHETNDGEHRASQAIAQPQSSPGNQSDMGAKTASLAPREVLERSQPHRIHPEAIENPPTVKLAEAGTHRSQRHRFTFRLTPDQHHRLRLAAAIKDQSLQHLLSEALDNHLDGLCACALKDCSCMAARI